MTDFCNTSSYGHPQTQGGTGTTDCGRDGEDSSSTLRETVLPLNRRMDKQKLVFLRFHRVVVGLVHYAILGTTQGTNFPRRRPLNPEIETTRVLIPLVVVFRRVNKQVFVLLTLVCVGRKGSGSIRRTHSTSWEVSTNQPTRVTEPAITT